MADIRRVPNEEWRGREQEIEELFKATYSELVSHTRSFLPNGDYEELAMQAFSRLARVAAKGELPERLSSSYLRTQARWVVTDHIRTLGRQQADLTEALQVESPRADAASSISDLIRSRGASELLYGAMDRARRSGDRTTFRVSALLLDIAESEGSVPSDRRVARELGISHVSVGKARARLRSLLVEELDAQAKDIRSFNEPT